MKLNLFEIKSTVANNRIPTFEFRANSTIFCEKSSFFLSMLLRSKSYKQIIGNFPQTSESLERISTYDPLLTNVPNGTWSFLQ